MDDRWEQINSKVSVLAKSHTEMREDFGKRIIALEAVATDNASANKMTIEMYKDGWAPIKGTLKMIGYAEWVFKKLWRLLVSLLILAGAIITFVKTGVWHMPS